MSNKLAQKQNNSVSPKQLLRSDNVQKKFEDMLGSKAQGFITSVLQCISNNKVLKNADPTTVYNAACTAAVLELPVNPNLGFAYIMPYKGQATLLIGYKGYIQLAQRSGLYKTISATKVFEGQIEKADPLKGYEFDWDAKKSDKVIGYVSFFELLNGFDKTFYMTMDEIENHAKKYSDSYSRGYGPWTDNFEGMALKTVLKLLITKYGPMTIDLQQAATFDQGVVKDIDKMEVDYVDNQQETDTEALGKQISGDVTGEVEEEVEPEPEPEEEDEDEKAEPFKPTKKQRENILDRAKYLTPENQLKLVKLINNDDMTKEGWTKWVEHSEKAEKKGKAEEKKAKKEAKRKAKKKKKNK